jgi:hypothetical protein
MILQLDNNNEEGDKNNNLLPGKPLTPKQLTKLIEDSRNSGIISMENAHQLIRNSYNSG